MEQPRCLECRDTGTIRYSTGYGLSDWIEEICPFCNRPVSEHDDGECPPVELVVLALSGKVAA